MASPYNQLQKLTGRDLFDFSWLCFLLLCLASVHLDFSVTILKLNVHSTGLNRDLFSV